MSPPDPHLQREAQTMLQSDEYRFCQDPNFQIDEDNSAYCQFADQLKETCPRFAEACARLTERKEVTREDHRESSREEHPAEGGGSNVATWLFFGVALAFVAVAVGYLIKNADWLREPAARSSATKKKKDDAVPDAEEAELTQVETDVARLLARARERAQRDPKRGMEDAYAALLRKLEGDGQLVLHPSRTNGDYLRTLKSSREVKKDLASIARELEKFQFGETQATSEDFTRFYQRVTVWLGRAAVPLTTLLLVLCFAGCNGGGPPAHPKHGSTEPGGSRVLSELLEQHGREVSYISNQEPPSKARIVVMLRSRELDPKAIDAALESARTEGTTVILAGSEDLPSGYGLFRHTGEVGPVHGHGSASFSGQDYALWVPPGADLDAGRLVTSATLAERETASGARPYAVKIKCGQGSLIVFADDWLFLNVSMGVADNASFMVSLFGTLPDGKIEFRSDAAKEHKEAPPLTALSGAHLMPAVFQLGAVLLLFSLMRGVHFGRPKTPVRTSRRAFAEHARALGAAFRRAKASRHALDLYGQWAVERLRERFLRGRRSGLGELAEAVAKSSGVSPGEALATLEVAVKSAPESVRSTHPRTDVASSAAPDELTTLRRLDQYLNLGTGTKKT